MLGRLAHNVTFVRVTLVVAWISMVTLLALLGLILNGMRKMVSCQVFCPEWEAATGMHGMV